MNVFAEQNTSSGVQSCGTWRHKRWNNGHSSSRKWWKLLRWASKLLCGYEESNCKVQRSTVCRKKWTRWVKKIFKWWEKLFALSVKEINCYHNLIIKTFTRLRLKHPFKKLTPLSFLPFFPWGNDEAINFPVELHHHVASLFFSLRQPSIHEYKNDEKIFSFRKKLKKTRKRISKDFLGFFF